MFVWARSSSTLQSFMSCDRRMLYHDTYMCPLSTFSLSTMLLWAPPMTMTMIAVLEPAASEWFKAEVGFIFSAAGAFASCDELVGKKP